MHVEAAVSTLASRQGGVVTRGQAMELGLSQRQISNRILSGRWTRFSTGAYRVLVLDSYMDTVRAAVAVLPRAVVSHWSAATIHGFDAIPHHQPSVLVHTKTTHQFPNVVVIRCHDLVDEHVALQDRLRVTTASRTVVDLASQLSIGRLARTLDGALASDHVTVASVRYVLEDVARRGKPGVTNIRRLLAERDGEDHSGSLLEARAGRLLVEAGFESFEREFPIPWAPHRRFDVAFPAQRVAVEWDSRRWHGHLGAFERDRERDRLAILHGWRVLRFTWADVHDRPEMVTDVLRTVLG